MERNRITRIFAVSTVSMSLSLGMFVFLVVIGIILRLNQGQLINVNPDIFYSLMTVHGIGMAVSLFIGAYSSAWFLLNKYIRLSIRLMWIVFLMNLCGYIGLLISTIIGNFGAGWYMLYPLPFILETWHPYTTTLIILSLSFWGFSWLFIFLDILRAIGAEYGLSGILGIEYLLNKNITIEIKPIIIIASSASIAGIISMFSGANLLVLYILKWENLRLNLDPLLLKNMVFLFGHTLVNITIYFIIACIYEILPLYTNRPWKTNKVVVIAWFSTVFLVIGAFLHHLSLDFSQPFYFQVIGQISSYLSAVPSTSVTVLGLIAQIYKSGAKLSFTLLCFCLGTMGWVIGGFAAVLDSTIPINFTFHNTMWVPAHFHTYFLMGYVLMFLGYFYHHINYEKNVSDKFSIFSLFIMLLGGYGFVLMFYIGGILSVPRRFAEYSYIPLQNVKIYGLNLAIYASIFAIIFLLGLLLNIGSFYKKNK